VNANREARIKNLRNLHQTIKKRHYPAYMEKDKETVLHALERRIFAINGVNYGLRSEQKVQAGI